MERIIGFLCAVLCCAPAFAAPAVPSPGRVSRYVDPQSYAYMYPYLNNKMRTAMNPGTTVSQTNNPIDVIVKTRPMAEPRRVVPRTSRAATTNGTARVATTANTTTGNSTRRVVPRTARAATTTASTARTATAPRATTRRNVRDDSATPAAAQAIISTEPVSSSRCLADYITCMNGYCARENTPYNRCYCSAKLAQIDSTYQPEISRMITQIINLVGGGQWSESEMNEYWMELVGQYAGENSWANLDNALNINWPEPEERMRGQNAFITGHNYCVQNLRACAYMSSNLRDAYRSQISRDCATYEQSLLRIKNAAAAMIEYYSE